MRALALILGIGWAAALHAADISEGLPSPELQASHLLGMDVLNLAGEEIGEVKDLVVDLATGKVYYALVGMGGFVGIGETTVALTMDVFTVGMAQNVLVADLDESGRARPPGPGAARASELLDEPRVRDLVVDVEAGVVRYAVLESGRVPFTDLARTPGNRR